MMMDRKVAIVTGGNSGIGRATAIALAREGAKVTVAARRASEGEETVRLVKEAGSDAIFVKTDMAIENDVRSLVEKTVDTYGKLDYAVNNAGIGEKMTPLVEQTSEKFDQIMNTNVRGVWLSMKYEIPMMIKNGGGAIVKRRNSQPVILRNSYDKTITEVQTLAYILRLVSEGKTEKQIIEVLYGDKKLVRTWIETLMEIHFIAMNSFNELAITPDGKNYLDKFHLH
jgi:NADP-dependent 3-hydroxy acid dehydrogenase YdfG